MTDRERDRGREFVHRYMAMHPVIKKGPVSRYAFLLNPMPVIASLLIVTLSGVSMVGAAENALPGDALYTVKVNVNEEVRLALAAPAKKADLAVERAERRIAEIETLAARGDLDDDLREEIDARLDAHVQAAEAASVARRSGSDVERRVVALLRAHEAMVAPGEIGGQFEDEIIAAGLAIEDVMHGENGEAATLAVAVSDVADVSASLMAAEPVTSALSLSVTAEPAIEARTMASESAARKARAADDAPPVASAKRASTISDKALARQKKTAADRIASLEQLIEREDRLFARITAKRKDTRDTTILHSGIESAREAFANAQMAQESGNALDASALWNSAVRIAIDAREAYAASARNDADTKQDDSEDEVDDESADHSRTLPRLRDR